MRRLAALVAAALLGCAQQGFPPGGPPRHIPPKLLTVSPESGSVNVHQKWVSLTFDEVVSERPAFGGQAIGDLVLISPRDGVPRVGWHRQRIDLRNDREWKGNTAYTVTLRPGLVDLHGNALRKPVVIVFATGAEIPPTAITGVVFDWGSGKPIVNALVQVFLGPDSTQYLTLADSSGRFTLLTLPPGPVTVRAVADANTNRALDPREGWDSATVQLRDTARVELYTFVHDSIGPRLSTIVVRDSVTLRVTFDKPVDLTQHLDTATFRLRGADSAEVPLRSVGVWREWEKARNDSAARADSAAGKKDTAAARRRAAAIGAPRDTTPKIPPPVPTRALANTEYVLILGHALTPSVWYTLSALGVRNLLGDSTSSRLAVQAPAPPKPPPAKDTTAKRPPPKAKPDSAPAPPTRPPLR